jgi:Ras-related protein Rab-4B
VSFSSTVLKLPSAQHGREKRMKLQLWDTAGQERFRSVTRNYCPPSFLFGFAPLPYIPDVCLDIQIEEPAAPFAFTTSQSKRHYCMLAPPRSILLTDTSHSRRSFENLPSWIADARALASPDLAIVLVGNKIDMEEERQVDTLEASRWAKENGQCGI